MRENDTGMLAALHGYAGGALERAALFLGRRCALCGAAIHNPQELSFGVCRECRSNLTLRTGGYCPGCGRLYASDKEDVYLCSSCRHAPEPWSKVGFFAPYSGLLKSLITAYKFRSKLSTGRILGRLMVSAFKAHGLSRPDMVVPVPLHPRRLYARGYNQSLELARCIVPDIGGILEYKALLRIRNTKAQSGLERKARLANLADAFMVRADCVGGKNVLIVDDVLTTGATLRTCARTLLRAGAAQVDVLVLARA